MYMVLEMSEKVQNSRSRKTCGRSHGSVFGIWEQGMNPTRKTNPLYIVHMAKDKIIFLCVFFRSLNFLIYYSMPGTELYLYDPTHISYNLQL